MRVQADMDDDPLTKLALAIAEEGWPPIACRQDRIPAFKQWYENADCDPVRIRADFGWGAVKHIGVPTGSKTGLLVVDVDLKHGPCAWHEANERRLTGTRRHTTPSGGFHYLFWIPGGKIYRCSTGKLAPSVDIRAEGGHVSWPDGRTRLVDRDLPVQALTACGWLLEAVEGVQPPVEIDSGVNVEVPPWLAADAEEHAGAGVLTGAEGGGRDPVEQARTIITKALIDVEQAAVGQRHYALTRAAWICGGYLWLAGLDEDYVIQRLVGSLRGEGIDFKRAEATARYQVEKGRGRPMDPSDRDPRITEIYRRGYAAKEDGATPSVLAKALLLFNATQTEPFSDEIVTMFAKKIANG
jgi:hypothetical protein